MGQCSVRPMREPLEGSSDQAADKAPVCCVCGHSAPSSPSGMSKEQRMAWTDSCENFAHKACLRSKECSVPKHMAKSGECPSHDDGGSFGFMLSHSSLKRASPNMRASSSGTVSLSESLHTKI